MTFHTGKPHELSECVPGLLPSFSLNNPPDGKDDL